MFKKTLLLMLLMAFMAPWAAMGQTYVYNKVTEAPTDWTTGKYLLVYNNSRAAANSTTTSGYYWYLNTVSVSVQSNTIEETNGAEVVSLELYSGSTYYIKNSENKYLKATRYKSGSTYYPRFEWVSTADSYNCGWQMTFNNGNITLKWNNNNDYKMAVSNNYITLSGTASSFSLYLQTEAVVSNPKPTNLTAGTPGSHTMSYTWDAPNNASPVSYTYQYKLATGDWDTPADVTSVTTADANTRTANLSGLLGDKDYNFRVRANYTEGSSDWVNADFTTEVSCVAPTSVAANSLTTNGATISWESDNNSFNYYLSLTALGNNDLNALTNLGNTLDKFVTYDNLTRNTHYYFYVRSVCGGDDGNSSWSSCEFSTVGYPAPTITECTGAPAGIDVVWEAASDESHYQLRYKKDYFDDWTVIEGESPITNLYYSITGLNESTSYYVQVGACYVGVTDISWSSSSTVTTLASCPKPTNLNYSNLTATSVVLNWTIGYNETSWNIRYKANNAAEWASINGITEKPYTMTVSDGTKYNVQIQSSCESDWSNEISFTTPCLPNEDFPFEENFNGLTTNGEIPTCWNNDDGTTTTQNYKWCYNTSTSGNGATNGTSHDGSKCIRFDSYNNGSSSEKPDNYLKTPVMNFPAGKTMVLGFWWKNPTGGDFSVYISTDGGATYTTSLKTGMTGQSTWKEEEIELPNSYVGAQNVVIVFKGKSNWGSGDAFIYLDDVTISEKNDCAKPKDLAVGTVDAHSATLGWDANGSEGPWQVAYSTTENFDLTDPTAYSTVTATTNPYTLGNLTNLNHYYVRVRAICGENYSDWNNNGYKDFTTPATYTAPTSVQYANVTDTQATISWTKGNDSEDNTHYTVWYKTGDTELSQDVEATSTSCTLTELVAGSNYEVKVRAKKGDDISEWSSSVNFQTEFCDPANQCNISYDLTDSGNDAWNGDAKINVVFKSSGVIAGIIRHTSGSSSSGTLALCDGVEYDFVWVSGSWEEENGFTIYDRNGDVIFEHTTGTELNAGVLFTYTMNCTGSTEITIQEATDITINSAKVNWTGGVQPYSLQYKKNSDVDWSEEIEVAAKYYVIEDLEPGTAYDVRVKSSGDENYVTAENNFTTLECSTPTELEVATVTYCSATLTWTAGNALEWEVQYKENDAADWTSFGTVTAATCTINGLAEETEYMARVKSTCNDTWVDFESFTTGTVTATEVSPEAPFSQSLNAMPEGWTSIDDKWTQNDTYLWSSNSGTALLLTPMLKITEDATISVKQKVSYSGNSNYTCTILASYDGGNTFEEGSISVTPTTNTTPSTNFYEVPANWIGKKLQIVFKYEATGSNNKRWQLYQVNIYMATTFTTDGDWNDASKWDFGVPTANLDAIINAAATIPYNTVAQAKNITIGTNGSLTLAEGGQLICNNAPVVKAQKSITAWTTGETTGGWYFIASPVAANLAPANVTNMLTANGPEDEHTYDFYYLGYDDDKVMWKNYRKTPFTMVNGQGYLYANQSAKTLEFEGAIRVYDAGNNTVPVTAGWNLIGNPYTFNAYITGSYYVIGSSSSESNLRDIIVAGTNGAAIAPCNGVIVKATGDGSVAFSKTAPTQNVNNGNLQMTLSQQVTNTRGNSNKTLDNAIVSFNEGCELEKFYFMQQNANLYIPQGAEEYAIATSNGQGTMPVNFRANENGQYTLTVNAENVEMNYLHLIDNMTGADVDLLATPSYTFNATTTDYESRFKLVFVSATDNAEGSNDSFAFISNGQLIIANEGQATLQVVDVMGRILSSETINGSVSKSLNAPAGIYMLRLVNGDNVKVQKMVVR